MWSEYGLRAVIPTSFDLFGITISVRLDDQLAAIHSATGQWQDAQNTIVLQAPGTGFPETTIEQAFWHEVVHACLSRLSYDEQSRDEAFVDRLGQCLYQIEKTVRFDERSS